MRPRTTGVFLLGVCLILAATCTKTMTMPKVLLGKWVTEDPRYEARYIEITETEVIFGTGTQTPTFFFIKKIKENKINEFVEWTFHCETLEKVPTDIVLFYTTQQGGTHFELRNQRQVQWIKFKE